MPKFIKMGLNGTGYIGKKESYSRSARKRLARRKVTKGYPITTPFNSITDVIDYFSGDRVTCLLCGKDYKKLGVHLRRIHDVTDDEYRSMYNIPWTYGLCCSSTSSSHSSAMKRRLDGGFIPPIKEGDELLKMVSSKRRKCPFKSEVGVKNLKKYCKPSHPLTPAPDGTMETFTQRRERLESKRGSEEFRNKMRSRPQCSASAVIERGFNKYWKGKKQSEDHKAKRFKKAVK